MPATHTDDFDTSRPFTRADAIAAGVEPRLLRGSRFRRIFRGVYVDAAVPDSPQLRGQAALRIYAGTSAFVSHASAARIHGVPIPPLPGEHVTVLHRKERKKVSDPRVHVASSATVMTRRGVRVSSYAQMFVELATMLTLVDLVVVGDNLAKRELIDPTALIGFCERSRHPASGAARRAAALVRSGVDSPMETRLRLLLVFAGLPEPEVNLTLRTEQGDPYRKYDLSYPQIKVIIEYDGRHHIEREDQWEADLERREAIDDDGWRILVVTAKGIYRDPATTVARVFRLLKARGLHGLPTGPREGWRDHFPGHG